MLPTYFLLQPVQGMMYLPDLAMTLSAHVFLFFTKFLMKIEVLVATFIRLSIISNDTLEVTLLTGKTMYLIGRSVALCMLFLLKMCMAPGIIDVWGGVKL